MAEQQRRETILIVEDDPINRGFLCEALSEEYETQQAENGKTALSLLDAGSRYAAVVLDLMMPIMGGYAFLEELSRRGVHNLPILVMTSEHDPGAEKKVLDLGAWDFVTKPIQVPTLLSRLRNAVARSQLSLLKELKYVLAHDAVTGLYNRARLFLEIERIQAAHPEKKYVFARVDIDRFHLFNSAMGEQEGDHLLRYLADEIAKATQSFSSCLYGRMESDVFCIFAEYDKECFEKALKMLKARFYSYRKDYLLELSVGIYLVEQPGISPETMLSRATLAQEKGKKQHRHEIFYFDKSMEGYEALEKEITGEMHTALDKKQFVVYLQPKYDLRSEQPYGAEALVRWQHPTKGLITPGAFIPVLEQNGFIARLDSYMWESVCALLKKWKDEGRRLTPVSVNMSRISLYNPQVVEILVGLVRRYDIPPRMLNLEVTESAYMSNTSLMKDTLSRLQQAGFLILMDDFGSGYSSLNTLKEINVDILKIDMKFMPVSNSDGKREIILSSIVRMAGWLGIPVVAEGVETLEQKQFLESIGCNFVQGYYYAKPMPVEEYESRILGCVQVQDEQKSPAKPMEAIWSADTKVDDLLKSISLPVAVYECSATGTEVVRVNDAYNKEFDYQKNVPAACTQLTYENRKRLEIAFRRAMENCSTEICEFSWKNPQGQEKWYRLKLQYLEQTAGASLLCGIYTDITTEKGYENKLSRIFQYLEVPAKKQSLLIVGEKAEGRRALAAIFENRYGILECETTAQAIGQMQTCRGELAAILLDMPLPAQQGKEFLQQKSSLREAAHIPTVIFSADRTPSVQRSMLQLGAQDYIAEPYVAEVALRRVENVIQYGTRFQDLLQEYRVLSAEN
jgi:diguanylate cyclase (GGDEF)-like protein